MESGVFPRRSVVTQLRKFIRVDLVTDRKTEQSQKNRDLLANRFHDVTLPLYVILDSEGKELRRLIGYTRDSADFVAFLLGDDVAD